MELHILILGTPIKLVEISMIQKRSLNGLQKRILRTLPLKNLLDTKSLRLNGRHPEVTKLMVCMNFSLFTEMGKYLQDMESETPTTALKLRMNKRLPK